LLVAIYFYLLQFFDHQPLRCCFLLQFALLSGFCVRLFFIGNFADNFGFGCILKGAQHWL